MIVDEFESPAATGRGQPLSERLTETVCDFGGGARRDAHSAGAGAGPTAAGLAAGGVRGESASRGVLLQKGEAAKQLAALPSEISVWDACSSEKDLADTAAVVASLDLVITTDTCIAHLAGAMGKPVWILLPHVADWRWMQDNETTVVSHGTADAPVRSGGLELGIDTGDRGFGCNLSEIRLEKKPNRLLTTVTL